MNNSINYTINNYLNNSVNLGQKIDTELISCMNKDTLSLECIYNSICPQFNAYFINTGLAIIITYVLISWLKWYFFKYGYKYINYDSENTAHKFIGNLQLLETRIYWDNWINQRFLKVMFIFIVIMVFLSRFNKI